MIFSGLRDLRESWGYSRSHVKILQSKLAKQQKVLEGCALVVLQKCWALQIPSEKNQRKILISGTLCAMPHQQYLSTILPRNWLKNKNKNKKTSTKGNQLQEKLCVTPQMIHWALYEDLDASQNVLLHWGLLIGKGKYFYLRQEAGVLFLETREKTYSCKRLKIISFSKAYIWQLYSKVWM